ncbi:hypothetical protein [Cytobacillus pseudoceanisediminis]|uniref:hypothetical protein n=1 Tax=Cytobacillus pseudoceanisediminis TaxID=3051614 RepID=UPI003C2B0615
MWNREAQNGLQNVTIALEAKSKFRIRRSFVERTLVKTAIYSFITSFSLMIVLIQRVRTTEDVNGMVSSSETTYPEFFFMILKNSIIITFIMVIIMFLYKRYKGK